MKIIRLIAAVAAIVLPLTGSAGQHSWSGPLISELQHGDIVYRRGVGAFSDLVARVGNAQWTHIGIAVQVRPGGKVYILHAIEERGVTLEPPAQFFSPSQATAGIFQRFPGGDRVADAAQRYLGKPFDLRFDLTDSSGVYCTELVMRALMDAEIGVFVPKRQIPMLSSPVIFPDDILGAVSNP